MINYYDALAIIAAAAEPLSTETVAPSVGKICAENLYSPVNVPGFPNSAMDGYAVRSADCANEGANLTVLGTITAGMPAPKATETANTAWEIMTGAPMPDGYDTVVPVERTRSNDGTVSIDGIPNPGANIRHPGEDFSTETPLIESGTVISPEILMGLAATGVDQILARKGLRIAIITTGNEISSELADSRQGIIRDSNRPYLEAVAGETKAEVVISQSVDDNPESLREAIEAARGQSDIILTTGGVSAGRMDFVPSVLAGMGAEILFHKVAIRPGKPLLFARFSDGTLVFGLPGNPVAVAVGWRFFVTAAIRQLRGQTDEVFTHATLQNDTAKRRGMRFFAKAKCEVNEAGVNHVEVLPGQQSFKISPLMQANCWAIFAEDDEQTPAGTSIEIAPLV